MKVLYDYQIFEMQRFGGISRYFFELINMFGKDEEVEYELPVRFSGNEYLKSIACFRDKLLPKSEPKNDYERFLWGAKFRGKGILYRVKNKFAPAPAIDTESAANRSAVIEKLQQGDFDVFHPTYYDEYFLDYIGTKPFVITVYDLIHQVFPEFGMYETRDKNKNLLHKAKKIIAISESTKRDLVSIFGIDEHKVVVTYLANSLQGNISSVAGDFKSKLPPDYMLFVGNRDAYKNFLFFTQVFASMSGKLKHVCVVCTGSPFSKGEIFFFNKLGIADKMYHVFVNDDELSFLYSNAIVFVFPSMYEGFGLPVLEAFNCGCPVVASHSSSLTEIGEDAVIYFEPKNPASMIRALNKVINDDALRMEMINKGYHQLAKFSWKQTADRTKEVYEEVIAGINI